MTKTNVHLIEDENLGGLLREYVESERKADVGDYVVITYFEGESVAHIAKVTDTDADANQFDFTPGISGDFSNDHLFDYDYETCKTLDPTDIVHVDGVRYKLVDRKAEVGEKVVVTRGSGWYSSKIGKVLKVINGEDLGFHCAKNEEYVYVEDSSNGFNSSICFIWDSDYLITEPVKSAPKLDELLAKVTPENKHAEITIDESQASPEVIEMLGNLAQRIVKLEAELDEYRALGLKERLEDGSSLFKRIYEEIDTLHSNQKRMAEELANLAAASNSQEDSAEVIVELAKLLVEKVREGGR